MTVEPTRPTVSIDTIVLDTDDLSGLATFYGELLGWKITSNEEDWITIQGDAGVAMGFQLAPNHRPPTWPSNEIPQQIHLDLHVEDLEEGARFAESLGARRVKDARQNGSNFIVFTDPSGHPFCLCLG
jgi:predicted enzyme related to lactoylglutathione lyase